MPFFSPSACANAWPSAMPASSVVWCWSTWRSPVTWRSRSKSAWREKSSSMWSRKPTPVAIFACPDPSRARLTETSVSAVRRLTRAARMGCSQERTGRRLLATEPKEGHRLIPDGGDSGRFKEGVFGGDKAEVLIQDHLIEADQEGGYERCSRAQSGPDPVGSLGRHP